MYSSGEEQSAIAEANFEDNVLSEKDSGFVLGPGQFPSAPECTLSRPSSAHFLPGSATFSPSITPSVSCVRVASFSPAWNLCQFLSRPQADL